MLIYKRIDASEGINFDKTEKSKEFMISNYWFFKDKNFNFENVFCNGCHDISLKCCELRNIATIKISGVVSDAFYGI